MPKIYSKGQVILPKALRTQVGLDVDDDVVIEARGNEIVIRRAPSLRELRLPRPRRASTDSGSQAETDAAWEEHVVNQFGPEGPA